MNNIFEETEPAFSVDGVGSISAGNHVYIDITYMIESWQLAEGSFYRIGLIDADVMTTQQISCLQDCILHLETGEAIAIAVVGKEAGFLEFEVRDPIEKRVA